MSNKNNRTLKAGWRWVKFGDVVRQCKEKADPETSGLERYIAGEHMDTDDLRLRRWGGIGSGYLGPAFHMRFKPGQVLYGSRRTYLRKVAVADFDGICANTTFVLESKCPNELLPEFLPVLMQTDAFNDFSIKNSKGSVNPYINFSDLARFEFSQPPIDEQKRVVEALAHVMTAVEATDEVISAAGRIKQSLALEVFASRDEAKPLGDFVIESMYGARFSNSLYSKSGAVAQLRTTDISDLGTINYSGIPLADLSIEDMRSHLLEKGDLVFSRSGTCGVTAVFEAHSVPTIPAAFLIRFRLKAGLNPYFANEFFHSPIGRQMSASLARGGVQKNVSASELVKQLVPVPSIEDQVAIVSRFESIASAVEKCKERRRPRIERLQVPGAQVHIGFAKLWENWLGPRLRGWMHERGRSLRLADPSPLSPTLESPEIVLDCDESGDQDDAIALSAGLTDPYEPGEKPRSNGTDMARAHVHALTRHSQTDLLSPPDHILPEFALAKLVRSAVTRAAELQSVGELRRSEPYVALLLAIAAGLQESALPGVSWISGKNSKPHVDGTSPVLQRPIVRPPNAVNPGPSLSSSVIQADDAAPWPLPQSLHTLLIGLTDDVSPMPGTPVLPWLAGDVGRPYRLNDVVRELLPELHVSARVCRLVLAAHLARSLGPDVAQLVLGDTFSMSAAPTYYTAPRHRDLVKQVMDIQSRWFGPSANSDSMLASVPDGHVGSRLVLTDAAAQSWPKSILRARRYEVNDRDPTDIDAWIRHRDFVGASLAAATAHRPVDALADLRLSDVIPEYGLVVLRDKQVDPLRSIRIVATGARWTTALRVYLDRLVAIEEDVTCPESSRLALAILTSEAPLFEVPDQGGRGRFTAACLRETMPEPLRAYANHYRHRLCQQLQYDGVDAELRFAQLGWVVSEAHATADLSPLSARDLANEMGPHIDDILVRDGWFGSSQRIKPWHWRGVPLTALPDWKAITRAHEEKHLHEVKRLRANLVEKGKETRNAIRPRLALAIQAFLPAIRLESEGWHLVRAEESAHPARIAMDEAHCSLIEEKVLLGSKSSSTSLEKLITRIELVRLIKRAHRDGITEGFIPRRPFVSFTSEPSPFLPGIGTAVRHAERIREILIDRCRDWRPHDRGPLTYLATILFSPYRSAAWAERALKGASTAARGQRPGDTLRIDTVVDRKHAAMVFSGTAAILLSRRSSRAPTAIAPTSRRLNAWLESVLSSELAPQDQQWLDAVIESARVAGRVELSGQERLLMLGSTQLTCVPKERCLAWSDHWPAKTTVFDDSLEQKPSAVLDEQKASPNKSAPHVAVGYKNLLKILNPASFAKLVHEENDNQRGLHQALIRHLQVKLDEAGSTTNLGLVIGFALHRTRYGGIRKSTLEASSVHTNVTRFARTLLDIAGPRSVIDMDDDTLRQTYLAVLQAKLIKARPLAFETLKQFHGFLELSHRRQPMNYAELQSFAGMRGDDTDPGLLTSAEVDAVYEALMGDLRDETGRADASPEFVRIAELRIVRFLLLEASGARPASIHGLVLDDVLLFGDNQDYIHIHKTGGYGSAKTDTSLGFVSLEGALWKRAREWFAAWLQLELRRLPADAPRNVPLFANTPGSRERFAKEMVEGRIGDLLRWATGEPDAHTYWLRKRRIQSRHMEAAGAENPRAKDVQTALRQSGHADIWTALTSYVHDPAIPMHRSLREGRLTLRGDILAITGLESSSLDMAWQRHGGPTADGRLSIVFDRLAIKTAAAPMYEFAPPPPAQHRHTLLPRHIHQFACVMQQVNDAREAALRVKLAGHQVERIQGAALALLSQRGCVPWHIDGLRHPRAVMKIPRNLKGAEPFLSALDQAPSAALIALAQDWGKTGHASRIMAPAQVLPLSGTAAIELARSVLRELGIRENVITINEEGPLPFLTLGRGGSDSSLDLTLVAVMQWLLAMVWVYSHAPNITAT